MLEKCWMSTTTIRKAKTGIMQKSIIPQRFALSAVRFITKIFNFWCFLTYVLPWNYPAPDIWLTTNCIAQGRAVRFTPCSADLKTELQFYIITDLGSFGWNKYSNHNFWTIWDQPWPIACSCSHFRMKCQGNSFKKNKTKNEYLKPQCVGICFPDIFYPSSTLLTLHLQYRA